MSERAVPRAVTEAARPARTDDVARLVELCTQALIEIAVWRGGELYAGRDARPAPYEVSLGDALDDPERAVLVGTLDGEVFGYVVGRVENLRDGTRLGIVEDLYVEAAARRVGVAAAMMNALLGWFRAEGCVAVDADAMPGDRLTKNFFESWGFKARRIVMHHRLDNPEPA